MTRGEVKGGERERERERGEKKDRFHEWEASKVPRGIVVTMLYSTSVYSRERETHGWGGRDGGWDAACRMLSSRQCSNHTSLGSILVIIARAHTHTHTHTPFPYNCHSHVLWKHRVNRKRRTEGWKTNNSGERVSEAELGWVQGAEC